VQHRIGWLTRKIRRDHAGSGGGECSAVRAQLVKAEAHAAFDGPERQAEAAERARREFAVDGSVAAAKYRKRRDDDGHGADGAATPAMPSLSSNASARLVAAWRPPTRAGRSTLARPLSSDTSWKA
jgi:hypothetical protein